MRNNEYPRIKQLNIKINKNPVEHIKWPHLREILKKNGIEKEFYEFYGVQTALVDGPYCPDVESVLERILSKGKNLIGTQNPLLWD